MKYKYYYCTRRRVAGIREFDDFFEAIKFMGEHKMRISGLIRAELWNRDTNELICTMRTVG